MNFWVSGIKMEYLANNRR